ncbi:hypothetical protein BGZ68_005190 [Mortierella alpina]|nr:hypothetical protein BGZ68_005190 [Mortierella alpina]
MGGHKVRRRSPLDVPEILERILSYLNQHTLRFNAAWVCQEWNNIVRPLLLRDVTWTADRLGENYPQTAILERLEFAQTLYIKDPADRTDRFTTFRHENWTAFLKRLDTLANKDRRLNISCLSVQCHMSVHSQVPPLLKLLGFRLVRLRFENLHDLDVIVGSVLIWCPQLTHLYVRHRTSACFQTATMHQGTKSIGLREELRLRSLGLDGMAIENVALFSVLRLCPNLEDLQLTGLRDSRQVKRCYDDSATPEHVHLVVFGKPFFQRLVAFCPRIHSLDLSTYDNHFRLKGPTNQELIEAFSLLPGLKKTALLAKNVSLDILNTLSAYLHNTLTTLEIVDGVFTRDVGDILHGYLCNSPNLLHLKAPTVQVTNAWFDLEGILTGCGYYRRKWTTLNNPKDFTDASYANASKRKIWACRHLRTLDLKFDRSDDSSSQANSRMIFSYLSKVCPQLEDLTIRRRWINLSLHVGFCLLSRLQKLRRLTILGERRGPLKRRDLAWISEYMTPAQKLEMLVCSVPYSFSKFSRIYPRTPFGNASVVGKSSMENTIAECGGKKDSEARPDYMVDGIDMRGLGRVQDVVHHATQRLMNSDRCWPHLEYLEISSEEYGCFPHEGPAEMWIKAYRPATEVVHRRGGIRY